MPTKPTDEHDEGFTLIELLVVIIIIGILASIAIPTFLGQRERANRAALTTDLRNMANGAQTFYTDNLTYTGFAADAEFIDYERSPGVIILDSNTSVAPGGEAFCIQGSHPLVATSWRYDSAGSPPLGPGTCTP